MTKIRQFSFTCPNCGQTINSSSHTPQASGPALHRAKYLDGTPAVPSMAETLIFCPACGYADTAVRKTIPERLKKLIQSSDYQAVFTSFADRDLAIMAAAEQVCEQENKLHDLLGIQKAMWHLLPESALKETYGEKYLRTFSRYAEDSDREFTPNDLLEHAEFLRCLGRFDEASSFLSETDRFIKESGYFDVNGSQKGFENLIKEEYQAYQEKYILIKQLIAEGTSESYTVTEN